jgi:kumamolisin
MRRAGFVVGLTMAALAAAAPTPAAAAGSRPIASAARVGAVPAAMPLQLVLPLRSRNAALERFATSVTTQGSPNYGQYESLASLARNYGASKSTRTRVIGFLRNAGATKVRIDPTGLFADATLTAGRAQRVFDTPLARFRGPAGARYVAPIGANAASAAARVPAGLRGVATAVVGLSTRPLAGAHAGTFWHGGTAAGKVAPLAHAAAVDSGSAANLTGIPSGCPGALATKGFTPNQYLTAYGYAPLQAADVLGQGETVALIEIDGFKDSDVNAFAQCFGLAVPAINAFGVGVRHQLRPGGESTLDLEVLDAAAPALKEIDVYEAHADPAETLQALTAPLHNPHAPRPQVISASLGLCEQDVFGAISSKGVNQAEASLAMASAAGITFLASSGDSGSADCTDNRNKPIHRTAVNYPASSWWVTGVGGTNFLLNPDNTIAKQAVWNDDAFQPGSAGGGGLSRAFGRPDYQKGTVAAHRRAVPDVSMLADIQPGYAIFCTAARPECDPGNPWGQVGGTSAATPLLAGGFALVDQQLQAAGRADLGLVNPLLYTLGRSAQAATVFSDVTIGSNDVFPFVPGGRPLRCCAAGPGFDEGSGWGSVNLGAFAGVAVATQPQLVHFSLALPAGQSPIAARRINATVSCSAACLAGAYAEVKIASLRPFEVDSFVSKLTAAGSKPVTMRFTGRELKALRFARSHGFRIKATVFGVVLDSAVNSVSHSPGVSIRARTRGKTLKIN